MTTRRIRASIADALLLAFLAAVVLLTLAAVFGPVLRALF